MPSTPGPVVHTHAEAAEYADNHRGAAPAGSNDFSCRPSSEHPKPVILAHGTDSNSYSDFAALAPLLAESGWCVFVLNYGLAAGDEEYGTGDIRVSAAQLGGFVDTVRAATGATRSTSSATRRAPLSPVITSTNSAARRRRPLGRCRVAELRRNLLRSRCRCRADTRSGGDRRGVVLRSARPATRGSELLAEVNTPTDTVPGVRYTTIGTNVDEVIQPPGNVALHSSGALNYVIQELCPPNLTGHFNMVYDPFSLSLMRHALDPDRYGLGECVPVALGTGIPEMIIQSNF